MIVMSETTYDPKVIARQLNIGFGKDGLNYSQELLAAISSDYVQESILKQYMKGTSNAAPRIDILLMFCSKEVHIEMPPALPQNAPEQSRQKNRRVRKKISQFPQDENGLYIIPMLDCDLSYLLEGHPEKRKAAADLKKVTGLSEATFTTLAKEQAEVESLKENYMIDDLMFPRFSEVVNGLTNFPDHDKLVNQLYVMLNSMEDAEPHYKYSERFAPLIDGVKRVAKDQLFGFEGIAYDYVTGQLYRMTVSEDYADLAEQQQFIVKLLTEESSIPQSAVDQTSNQDIIRQYAKVIVDDIYESEQRKRDVVAAKYEAAQIFGQFLDYCSGRRK